MFNFHQYLLNIDCGASSRYRDEDKERLESAKRIRDRLNLGLDIVWKPSRIDKILCFEKREVDDDEKYSGVNKSIIFKTTYMTGYPSQGSFLKKEVDRSNKSEVELINPYGEERKDD